LKGRVEMFKDYSDELERIKELLSVVLERAEHLDKNINGIARDIIRIKKELNIFHYSSPPLVDELYEGDIKNLVCDWLLIDIDMPAITIWNKIVGALAKSSKINEKMQGYAEWKKEAMAEWMEVIESIRKDIKENKTVKRRQNE